MIGEEARQMVAYAAACVARLGLAVFKRPAQHAHIAIHHPAFAMARFAMGLEEIGGDHRGDEARHGKAHQHGHDYRHAELDEELAGKAGHKRDRQEDRDNRHGGGEHGEADLVRCVDRSLIGGFAHAHVTHDILDLHDRVIDQHTCNQAQGEQRNAVERKAHHVHEPEGRDS